MKSVMNNKKIMIIVGVIILALAIFIISKGSSKKQKETNSDEPIKTNEISKALEDGQKVNKSEKMKETKKLVISF